MGGVVSSIGNAIGGIGGAVGSVANAIPGIGPYVGPVIGGITGGPLGFASSLAGNAIQGNYGGGGGGGGGGTSTTPMYAQPSFNYGNQTYQYGTTPVDASKYFITGDKGVYNLLPAFGQVNSNLKEGFLGNRMAAGRNRYTPYEAYNDIRTQMANDPKALAAFNAAYTPTPYNFNTQDKLGSLFGRGFGGNRRGTPSVAPFDYTAYRATNPFPQQNVDYGLNAKIAGPESSSFRSLSRYANTNNNPFFMPFETTQGATAMGFTPSAPYLAKDQALIDYNKNLNMALNNYYRPPVTPPVTPPPVVPPPIVPPPIVPPVTPPVTPTPVTPAPVTPTPVTPAPVTPTPVTPAPVTPTPVQPGTPGNFVAMNRGGLASLRRR